MPPIRTRGRVIGLVKKLGSYWWNFSINSLELMQKKRKKDCVIAFSDINRHLIRMGNMSWLAIYIH